MRFGRDNNNMRKSTHFIILQGFFEVLTVLANGLPQPENDPHMVEGASWGRLIPDEEYVNAGVVETIGEDLPIYRIGTGNERCVIWNPDIFGYDSGMTRQLADRLNKEINVTVIVVDYMRGDYPIIGSPNMRTKLVEKHNWEMLRQDWEGITKPYAENEHGCKVFGVHGTCSGTYLVMKLSAYPEVKAGVSAHPSHPVIMGGLGESEKEAYEAIKDSPQLFMPAGNDAESVQPGGLALETLGGKEAGHDSIVFQDMIHGWSVRGDISDPKVAKEVERAYMLACKHYNEYL